jgi:nuclear pore complex protein Nup188
VSILVRCFSPFSPSTPQTKSSFETRTSAINVTPSSHPRFNIKEIKENTLWLCKETNIDEISALRIAVVEWQTRPAIQLLQGDGDNQTTLRDDGGESGKFGASLFDPGSSLLAKLTPRNGKTSGFQEVGARHRRLLENYLSERRCILKCSEFITFMTLHSAGGPASHGQERFEWLKQIGADVLSAWSSGQLANCNHLVIDAVDTLRTRHKSIATGSGWFRDEGTQEDIELAWTRSQLLEMIHIMQITLNLIQSSSVLVKSPTILSWFRLMKESIFFESVQPVSSGPSGN